MRTFLLARQTNFFSFNCIFHRKTGVVLYVLKYSYMANSDCSSYINLGHSMGHSFLEISKTRTQSCILNVTNIVHLNKLVFP